MNADPAPNAVEPEPIMCKCGHDVEDHGTLGCKHGFSFSTSATATCFCNETPNTLLRVALAALRVENGRLVAERDELAKKLAERAKQDEEIYRNAKSILAKIHGQT